MKTPFKFLFIGLSLFFMINVSFGQVGITYDGSDPDSSAMLEVKSPDKGVLIPRMTATVMSSISNPARGLFVFCLDDSSFYVNRGTSGVPDWSRVNSHWNSSYLNDIYYCGGSVGIGTYTPLYPLHIVGGDMKLGLIAGDARKIYFGDGIGTYIGEEAVDDRLGLSGSSMRLLIGGTAGNNGQVLTSNGTTCSWANSAGWGSGTLNYLARWMSSNTLGTGIIMDDDSTVSINTPPDASYRLKVLGGGGVSAIQGEFDVAHYGTVGAPSYGVAGYNQGNTTGDAGVYGFSQSSVEGTPGVYGINNVSVNGSSGTLNNSVNGTVGFVLWGYPYHYGLFGSRYDDAGGPSAGVLGSVDYTSGSKPWGALGFQDAGSEEYAGYFNGNVNFTAGIRDGSGYGSSGSVLMSNGSTDAYWSASPGITGSGSLNYIPKWSGSSTLSNSVIYDNGTNVGIGSTIPSRKLTVNSGGVSTAIFGQYNSDIHGYLGSSLYGAWGQYNSTQYGYLGGPSYGVYGHYDENIWGYLGGYEGVGAYGQSSSTVKGYLGYTSRGVYGRNGNNYGILGDENYGVYGRYNLTGAYGYLGSSTIGAYGQYLTDRHGSWAVHFMAFTGSIVMTSMAVLAALLQACRAEKMLMEIMRPFFPMKVHQPITSINGLCMHI